jgi:pyrimidine-nucleoside phosphorylase
LTLTLTSEMLIIAGKAGTSEQARELCTRAIGNGDAYHKFVEMVEYQGGNVDLVKSSKKYPRARFIGIVESDQAGIVTSFDTRETGLISVELGAGRKKAEDQVDPQAGIIFFKKIGDKVEINEPIAEIHSNKPNIIEHMKKRIMKAIEIKVEIDKVPELILKKIE